jgi:hypothetical protein
MDRLDPEPFWSWSTKARSACANVRRTWASRGQRPCSCTGSTGRGPRWPRRCATACGVAARSCAAVTAGNYDPRASSRSLASCAASSVKGHPVGTAAGPSQHRHAGLASRPAAVAGGGAAAGLHAPPQPVEALWSSLKAVELPNLTDPTLAEVIAQAQWGIKRVRRTPHLACLSCGTPASQSHDAVDATPRP